MRIVLPSNSSLEHFPNNTLGTYTTQLATPLDLPRGEWEVGLAEIQYTRYWYNVRDDFLLIGVRGDKQIAVKAPLKTALYSTIDELIREMRMAIERVGQSEHITIGIISTNDTEDYHIAGADGTGSVNRSIVDEGKVYFDMRSSDLWSLDFSDNLKHLLSMDDLCYDRIPDDTSFVFRAISCKRVDLDRQYRNLYVYCDLVEATPVGDTLAPLLRIVHITGISKKHVSYTFDRIQYVPLAKRNTPTILIYIRRDDGLVVPFIDGRTVVTLDIRRARRI